MAKKHTNPTDRGNVGHQQLEPHPEYILGGSRERRYDRHPLSAAFALMNAPAFGELCRSLQVDGQIEPIIVYENQILDGYHRDEAAYVIGAEPHYVAFEDLKLSVSPLDFVLSKNLHRRHLSPSARAIAVARLANVPHGGDMKRIENSYTLEHLARMADVSRSLIVATKKVLASGNAELIAAIETQGLSVTAALAMLEVIPPEERSGSALESWKTQAREQTRAKRLNRRPAPITTHATEPLDHTARAFNTLDRAGYVLGEPHATTFDRGVEILRYCASVLKLQQKADIDNTKIDQLATACREYLREVGLRS